MISRVGSVAFDGIQAREVDVQVSITSGLPAFNIVGLADKAISESKERVRSAFSSLGFSFPAKRVTVNLSPADISKEGSHFDLPIALSIMGAADLLPIDELINYIALGELSLDGNISPINGILVASILASSNSKGMIIPYEQLNEIYIVRDKVEVLPIRNLVEIIHHFKGKNIININTNKIEAKINKKTNFVDFANIKGHLFAKRALEVTAAGGHNLLMIGPPGSGKSMLANALGGIMPPMTSEEALEVSLVYSISGHLDNKSFIHTRPYRSPHHSSSLHALVGGGPRANKPGEISLSHHGILFLDEIAEFNRNILDALRQPLETGYINISRVRSQVQYPANFQLIGAMNPCRCGYFGDAERQCSKIPKCAEQYKSRISGPILDRMDIVIEVPVIPIKELTQQPKAISSAEIRKKVIKSRNLQKIRYLDDKIQTNSQASPEIIEIKSNITNEARDLLERSVDKFKLSTRAYFRLIKVARTCADLDSSKDVNIIHVAEAINYRGITY